MKSIKRIAKRIIEINEEIEVMKGLYRELDELTALLLEQKFKKGHGVRVVDNFAKKNVAFRTTGLRRFEIVSDGVFPIRKRR